MHLIFIFGPPAVGKMTVGHELAVLTGYKLFHNHLSIEPLLPIFDRRSESFARISGEIRHCVIEEAVTADLTGLIFTYVWALDDPGEKAHVDGLLAPVINSGARLDFVELFADQETRLAREGTEFRTSQKPSKRDVGASQAFLRRADDAYQLNTRHATDFPYPDRLLRIDNSELAADVVARQVGEAFGIISY